MRNHELNHGLGVFAWDVSYLYRVGGFIGVVFGVSAALLSYQIRSMVNRHEPRVDARRAAASRRDPGSEYFLG